MPQLGMGELFLIFLVVLLIFGASQIPKVAKGLGQGLREFKKAARELQDDDTPPPTEKPAPPKNDTGSV
jgi:sec-independent protein translocase protein TatA